MSTNHHTKGARPEIDLARFGVAIIDSGPAAKARVAVLASRFNRPVVDRLVEGALATLAECGVDPATTMLVRVAGAWELPVAAAVVARSGRYDAVIALGCVIRGDTVHFEVIVNESARGLMAIACETGVPVANGVLACENEEQAYARAGGSAGNKGAEATLAALELAGLRARMNVGVGA